MAPINACFLIRHGRPSFWQSHSYFELVSGSRYPQLVSEYNRSSIDIERLPQKPKLARAQKCSVLFTSDLPRAVDSGKLLGIKQCSAKALFREAEIPPVTGSAAVMPLFAWMFWQRLRWFLGQELGCETYREFRQRISDTARFLDECAAQHDSISVVAHGFTNKFLAKAMAQYGWNVIGRVENGHWGVTELAK